MRTYVFYDVIEDRIRKRIYDCCRDFGLRWLQYSGFSGDLSRIRRGELCAALRKRLGGSDGAIVVVPLCERDEAGLVQIAGGTVRSRAAAKLEFDRHIMRRLRALSDE